MDTLKERNSRITLAIQFIGLLTRISNLHLKFEVKNVTWLAEENHMMFASPATTILRRVNLSSFFFKR